MAPEYATSGKLTEKSDVFSYGVVLLELITGRKPVDASQPLGDESLVEWVIYPYFCILLVRGVPCFCSLTSHSLLSMHRHYVLVDHLTLLLPLGNRMFC